MSLDALLATVRDRQLRFTRVDAFWDKDDPFEGSVPKQTIDDQFLLVAGARNAMRMHTVITGSLPEWEEPEEKVLRLRAAKIRSAYACCWAAGEKEIAALWQLKDPKRLGIGVALQTTLGKLRTLVPRDVYVRPITYRDYHEGPAFDDELDLLMHKRTEYSFENEVRLLKIDDAHYAALRDRAPAVAELDKYWSLSWTAADVIEHIVLSPYAKEDFEQRARAAIEAADASLRDRVILSVLNPRRYPPNF